MIHFYDSGYWHGDSLLASPQTLNVIIFQQLINFRKVMKRVSEDVSKYCQIDKLFSVFIIAGCNLHVYEYIKMVVRVFELKIVYLGAQY